MQGGQRWKGDMLPGGAWRIVETESGAGRGRSVWPSDEWPIRQVCQHDHARRANPANPDARARVVNSQELVHAERSEREASEASDRHKEIIVVSAAPFQKVRRG